MIWLVLDIVITTLSVITTQILLPSSISSSIIKAKNTLKDLIFEYLLDYVNKSSKDDAPDIEKSYMINISSYFNLSNRLAR